MEGGLTSFASLYPDDADAAAEGSSDCGCLQHLSCLQHSCPPPPDRLALASVACNTSVPGQCPPGDQVDTCFALALQHLVQQYQALKHPVCNNSACHGKVSTRGTTQNI